MPHTGRYTHNWTQTLSLGRSTLISKLRHRIFDPLSRVLFLCTVGRSRITISKQQYRYLTHWYNYTWTNERAIEIPFFSRLVSQFAGKNVLEVGNTLSHYQSTTHTIVDKYEIAPNVINSDVLTYHPTRLFDLIIAISTLEHVGWHEKEKRAQKSLAAISHLQSLLTPKGKLIFSFPIGVNPALDDALRIKAWPQAKRVFLRRCNRLNVWKETTYAIANTARYNDPYPNANAVCIITLPSKK